MCGQTSGDGIVFRGQFGFVGEWPAESAVIAQYGGRRSDNSPCTAIDCGVTLFLRCLQSHTRPSTHSAHCRVITSLSCLARSPPDLLPPPLHSPHSSPLQFLRHGAGSCMPEGAAADQGDEGAATRHGRGASGRQEQREEPERSARLSRQLRVCDALGSLAVCRTWMSL